MAISRGGAGRARGVGLSWRLEEGGRREEVCGRKGFAEGRWGCEGVAGSFARYHVAACAEFAEE